MKSRVSLVIILIAFVFKLQAQNSDNLPRPIIVDYINAYKEIAISEMKRTGVPAAIKLAQGIHETEAGTSELVRKSNNHFGIKCKNTWTGASVSHDDDARGECFRSYPSSEASYMDHSNFLKGSPRYASLFELDPTDFEGWAYGLRKAGYATNNKYAVILIRIIKEYHLQDYNLIALGKMRAEDEWLASLGISTKPIASADVVTAPAGTIPVTEKIIEKVTVQYPIGEFKLNQTRVVYAAPGASLLGLAEQFDIPLKRLIEFNDWAQKDENILQSGQLVFLQRKRKMSHNEFHIVTEGESLNDISQTEGLRLESLLEYNLLSKGMQPAVGEMLYLQSTASTRPTLASSIRRSATSSYPLQKVDEQKDINYTTHVVQMKETLFAISKKYNVPVEKLKEWNNLVTYELKSGQELIIYKN